MENIMMMQKQKQRGNCHSYNFFEDASDDSREGSRADRFAGGKGYLRPRPWA